MYASPTLAFGPWPTLRCGPQFAIYFFPAIRAVAFGRGPDFDIFIFFNHCAVQTLKIGLICVHFCRWNIDLRKETVNKNVEREDATTNVKKAKDEAKKREGGDCLHKSLIKLLFLRVNQMKC